MIIMNDNHHQHQGTTNIVIISKSVVMRLFHTFIIILYPHHHFSLSTCIGMKSVSWSSSCIHFKQASQCSLFWSLPRLTKIVITLIIIEGAREAGAAHVWAVWKAVCSVLQPEDTLENTFWGLYSQDEIRNWKKKAYGKIVPTQRLDQMKLSQKYCSN